MAAFKRPGSRLYWIGPFRAGAVDVPRMSTKQTDKRTARAMEEALRSRAVTGHADLVEQVAQKTLDLAEFYTAHLRGSEALEALRGRANDPLLSDCVADYRPRVTDERVRDGLDQLLRLAPKGARLSYLRTPSHLGDLYAAAIAGKDRGGAPRAPNSVRRSLHRAISELLMHKLGRGQMLAILADVKKPSAPDERVVILTVEEIRRALELADAEFQPVLGLAVTTGVDLGPLLRLTDADYNAEEGTLRVSDEKTSSRPRTLLLRGEPVLENAEHWLGILRVWAAEPNDRLVTLTERQIRGRWEAVRKAIGRPDVRWKDLRGLFATYYLQAGGDPRTLQHVLGHAAMTMTLRYLRRLPVGSRRHVSEAARRVGLLTPNLRIEKGGAA